MITQADSPLQAPAAPPLSHLWFPRAELC